MASELINSAQSTGLEEKEHVFFAQVELKEVKPTVILHRANSRNLEVPPVDLIFCEAVDAELVGEGFLQNFGSYSCMDRFYGSEFVFIIFSRS
eukprot:g28088.t1